MTRQVDDTAVARRTSKKGSEKEGKKGRMEERGKGKEYGDTRVKPERGATIQNREMLAGI